MGPDILVPISFFALVAVIVVGLPLARAHAKRVERGLGQAPVPNDLTERLTRMEQAIESVALEVERISEGQRFTTKLLSERAPEGISANAPGRVPGSAPSRMPGSSDAR